MYRYHQLWLSAMVFTMLGWGIQPTTSVMAADCATTNTICIDPTLVSFWTNQGGLPIFGYPLAASQSLTVDGIPIIGQQFERARLEYHPNNPDTYTVLLGRLGAESLAGVDVDTLDAVDPPHTEKSTLKCKNFAGTPYQACGDFLAYWQRHGLQQDRNPAISDAESLALFGLPLTPPYRKVIGNESFVVQVFERARMEYHPNNPLAYRIQLGLLGSELQMANNSPVATPAPINSDNVVLLPQPILDTFRSHMPYTGYWEHSSDGIYVAVSGFKYLTEFYGAPAPDGQRYVAMSVLIVNMREPSAASIYIDRTYFQLTDIDGNPPQSALSNSTDLKTEFLAQTVAPGARMGGQLIFLIPNKYGVPKQLTVTVANMDTYHTHSSQIVEFRVWPIGAYQEPTK